MYITNYFCMHTHNCSHIMAFSNMQIAKLIDELFDYLKSVRNNTAVSS